MSVQLKKRWKGTTSIPILTEFFDLLNDEPKKKRKRRCSRTKYSTESRKKSTFWMNYIAPVFIDGGNEINKESELLDETSKLGKEFRRRFRVPYQLYLDILKDLMSYHGVTLFMKKVKGNLHTEGVDIRLQVLASLRFLSCGCAFDLLEELTNIHQTSVRIFFLEKFSTWAKHASTEYIIFPDDIAGLNKISQQYDINFLPGCVGSIDCVHVVWDNCPAGIRSLCKGKGEHPTLAFQVICSHQRQILHVSPSFWGATNDKTIARFDQILNRLKEKGSLYDSIEWDTITDDGKYTISQRGVYLISDGGYHRWKILIPPYKDQIDGTDEEKWSSLVESVRKDIECVFGIMKKRFLFLKHAIRFQNYRDIEGAFLACCLLHNLILAYDGKDDDAFTHNLNNYTQDDVTVDYTRLDNAEIMKDAQRSTWKRKAVQAGLRSLHRAEYGIVGEEVSNKWYGINASIDESQNDEEEEYIARREYLMNHYKGLRLRQKQLRGGRSPT